MYYRVEGSYEKWNSLERSACICQNTICSICWSSKSSTLLLCRDTQLKVSIWKYLQFMSASKTTHTVFLRVFVYQSVLEQNRIQSFSIGFGVWNEATDTIRCWHMYSVLLRKLPRIPVEPTVLYIFAGFVSLPASGVSRKKIWKILAQFGQLLSEQNQWLSIGFGRKGNWNDSLLKRGRLLLTWNLSGWAHVLADFGHRSHWFFLESEELKVITGLIKKIKKAITWFVSQ